MACRACYDKAPTLGAGLGLPPRSTACALSQHRQACSFADATHRFQGKRLGKGFAIRLLRCAFVCQLHCRTKVSFVIHEELA